MHVSFKKSLQDKLLPYPRSHVKCYIFQGLSVLPELVALYSVNSSRSSFAVTPLAGSCRTVFECTAQTHAYAAAALHHVQGYTIHHTHKKQ